MQHCRAADWNSTQIDCVRGIASTARTASLLPQREAESTCGFAPSYLTALANAKDHYTHLTVQEKKAYRAK